MNSIDGSIYISALGLIVISIYAIWAYFDLRKN